MSKDSTFKVSIKYRIDGDDLPGELTDVKDIIIATDNTVTIIGDNKVLYIHPDNWLVISRKGNNAEA